MRARAVGTANPFREVRRISALSFNGLGVFLFTLR